jgi:RNA polymerase sigma-70 factor (ECF subfamily)
MTSSTSDNNPDELRERLIAGDRQALAELFARHRERLRRMVDVMLDRRLYGRVDAEDILQEAYLDASDRIEQYIDEHSGSLFVWLRMNVKQTLFNVHRRHLGTEMRDANRDVSLFSRHRAQASSASFALQLLGQLTSPSQLAIRQELIEKLEEALLTMAPIDREVLTLRHFDQLTNSEVAAELGIQVKAASIRYTRALRRLKAILGKSAGLSDA